MKLFITLFIFLGTYLAADVHSTREVLTQFSANEQVIASFDRTVRSWEKFKSTNPNFDLDLLLSAIEVAKQYQQLDSSLQISEILWNEGSIRNSSLLAAALLKDIKDQAEIQSLFGSRVAYIVAELSDDKAMSEEDRLQNLFVLSMDAQIIKMAEILYTLKTLYPVPEDLSDDEIRASYDWADKIISALSNTNKGLESALKDHINEFIHQINGPHIIGSLKNDGHEWDEAYKISYRSFYLDNGSEWKFEEKLVEKFFSKIYFWNHIGYEVVIKPLDRETKKYEMTFSEHDGTTITVLFEKQKDNLFLATYAQNVSVSGTHTVVNLKRSSQFGTWFYLEGDYRGWFMDSWKDNNTIHEGSTVEITFDGSFYWVKPKGHEVKIKFLQTGGKYEYRTY